MKVRHERNAPDDKTHDQAVSEDLEIRINHNKEVLTPEDLAELLGISVWTIYAKTSKRNRGQSGMDLPRFFRMGKLIRFWRRDLVSWLESREKIDPNESSKP
jgi:predicted DNA-binding transcriptional regulator AlpA